MLTYTSPNPDDILIAWFHLLIHFIALDFLIRLLVVAIPQLVISYGAAGNGINLARSPVECMAAFCLYYGKLELE